MPNQWETTYGLDPQADDATQDKDGDGMINLEEYISETDTAGLAETILVLRFLTGRILPPEETYPRLAVTGDGRAGFSDALNIIQSMAGGID